MQRARQSLLPKLSDPYNRVVFNSSSVTPNFPDHFQTSFAKLGTLSPCRFPFQIRTFLVAAVSLKHGSDLISRPQAERRSENRLARATGEKKKRARGCFARQREGHPRLSSAVGELGYGS